PVAAVVGGGAGGSAQETAQCGVDLLAVGPEEAVGRALDLDVLRVGEQLAETAGRGIDGQDVVGGAVQDEGWFAAGPDRCDVGAEVLDPGRDDGVRSDGGAGEGHVPARGNHLLADPGTEVLRQVVEV